MIPRRLVRVVPERTTEQVEAWWRRACDLHPDWEHVTLRDPLDPADWPATGGDWPATTSGAQLAGLIRLEEIHAHGGVYLDSDVEVFRSFDPLLASGAFAAWEDRETVPDAVFGAEAGHPAIADVLIEALRRLRRQSADWRTGSGAWSTGPGAFTATLTGRSDVLLLPPGAFYPYHYTEPGRSREDHGADPWCFAAHHWHASWVS